MPHPSTTSRLAPSPTVPRVPLHQFAKDHWSLLAYVESRTVDRAEAMFHAQIDTSASPNTATLDRARLRINGMRRPVIALGRGWSPAYGTRVQRTEDQALSHDGASLAAHDDLDCLNDLEHIGLVECLNVANLFVRLTPRGTVVAHALRHHKASGGQYRDFTPPAEALTAETMA